MINRIFRERVWPGQPGSVNVVTCLVDFKAERANLHRCVDVKHTLSLFLSLYLSFSHTYTHVYKNVVAVAECPTNQYGINCNMTCECRGRGTCNKVHGCICQTAWTGPTCTTDVDECKALPNACPPGWICTNTNGSYKCDCPPGYVNSTVNNTCVGEQFYLQCCACSVCFWVLQYCFEAAWHLIQSSSDTIKVQSCSNFSCQTPGCLRHWLPNGWLTKWLTP